MHRAVAENIDLSATRQETLSWLALLIMQRGTISLWRLAAFVSSPTQIASVRRRSPFQVRSATLQHRRHGGVEAMRAQRAPLRLTVFPARLCGVVYAGFLAVRCRLFCGTANLTEGKCPKAISI
jgi:hypothetical protein